MSSSGRWIRGSIVAGLVILVLGRWLGGTLAEHYWADALGIGDAHRTLDRLRWSLFIWAFVTAVLWCAGNLYVVYRSIGSVHVPRRLANLEITEALPRRYLAYGVMGIGVILAFALSHNADEWWRVRALADSPVLVGMRDPVLGREAGYYLFRLPWHRALHGFATLASGVMLGVSMLLHVAVGAVRIEGRRLVVSDFARRHLAGLLAAFALVLAWGYQLEPSEYVAGIHGVPVDAILTEVRLPTSRLLTALALLAMITSLMWMRFNRVAIVVFGWTALATFSLVGHYIVPSVAARARPSRELRVEAFERARDAFTAFGYGIAPRDTVLAFSRAHRPGPIPDFRDAPLWDEFAATVFLNRLASEEPHLRLNEAYLDVYESRDGGPVPVIIGAREPDWEAIDAQDPSPSWEQVHVAPLSAGTGLYALRADRVSPDGLPFFVGDLDQPGNATPTVQEVRLGAREWYFGPGLREFAVRSTRDNDVRSTRDNDELVGVRLGGPLRRTVLAWRLQSPRLLTAAGLTANSIVAWHRDAAERLQRVAPFARFERPYPVVIDGRLQWVSFGYVASASFPLTRRARWLGRNVRYLRAGMVGVVDAVSGRSAVHLLPNADALSEAWSVRFPALVKSDRDIPRGLRRHLRYPRQLFEVQLSLIRGPESPDRIGSGFWSRDVSVGDAGTRGTFWWVGRGPGDGMVGLRRMAVLERGDPPLLTGFVEGRMKDGRTELHVYRVRAPLDIPGPSQLVDRFRAESDLDSTLTGPLKAIPLAGGVLSLQSIYSTPGEANDAPRLVDVVAGWGGAVGRAPNLDQAVRRAREIGGDTGEPIGDWSVARRWFEQLHRARRSGDWTSFGEAYDELVRLFGLHADSTGGP